jgi:hypothetical protein
VATVLLREGFPPHLEAKLVDIFTVALKIDCKVDLRKIIPFELFLVQVGGSKEEYYQFFFHWVKKRLVAELNVANVYTLSRIMYFALGYNKLFEFKTQYYFVKGIVRRLLAHEITQKEAYMAQEKALAFIRKLPQDPFQVKLTHFKDKLEKEFDPEAVKAFFGKV